MYSCQILLHIIFGYHTNIDKDAQVDVCHLKPSETILIIIN